MTIVQVHKKINYQEIVEKNALRDKSISWETKRFLIFLLNYPYRLTMNWQVSVKETRLYFPKLKKTIALLEPFNYLEPTNQFLANFCLWCCYSPFFLVRNLLK